VHPPQTEVHPRQSDSSIFEEIEEIWKVGVDKLVVLACALRATSKNRQLVGGTKVHPRENPGYAHER